MRASWIYVMTNRPNGTLYLGVTNESERRVAEHKGGAGSAFTRRYGLHRLVYFESHEEISAAIQRETRLKRWPRAWKVRLIVAGNPAWADLAADCR